MEGEPIAAPIRTHGLGVICAGKDLLLTRLEDGLWDGLIVPLDDDSTPVLAFLRGWQSVSGGINLQDGRWRPSALSYGDYQFDPIKEVETVTTRESLTLLLVTVRSVFGLPPRSGGREWRWFHVDRLRRSQMRPGLGDVLELSLRGCCFDAIFRRSCAGNGHMEVRHHESASPFVPLPA